MKGHDDGYEDGRGYEVYLYRGVVWVEKYRMDAIPGLCCSCVDVLMYIPYVSWSEGRGATVHGNECGFGIEGSDYAAGEANLAFRLAATYMRTRESEK